MTRSLPQNTNILIRPVQYGDLEAVNRFCVESLEEDGLRFSINPDKPLRPLRLWYGPLRFLSRLLNRPHLFGAYQTDHDNKLQGIIQISPFNRTRSTWRVDRVAAVGEASEQKESTNSEETAIVAPSEASSEPQQTKAQSTLGDVGSLLLRYCFETIWEARTWLIELNVNDKDLMALYRQNGFQPLAHMSYWEITPGLLQDLVEQREPDLPNLLPVSNADAQLLYQLDTMSMPPLVRQVFDRHISDFKIGLFGSLMQGFKNWLSHLEVVSGYVFEPQRKAAIGYFQIHLCRDGSRPHQAQLTVNPAYTWLYPELMSQMARIAQDLPSQSLQLASSDYQPEREEYLEHMGATRIAHTLMMSRSIWHKVRESKLAALENLQFPEVLQGLQPARKQPIPSRISALRSVSRSPQEQAKANANSPNRQTNLPVKSSRHNQSTLNLSSKTDFSDPPQEGPCC